MVAKRSSKIQSTLLTACLLFTAALTGCSLGTRIQGERYLKTSNFDQGIEQFSAKVQISSDDGYANYYLGRFLLAKEQFVEAHTHLQKAVRLKEDSADFYFWLGVAQWSLGLSADERQSYEKALSIDPDHLQAHIYLGHNFLDSKEYSAALAHYDAALRVSERHPEALYNKGLALEKLDRKKPAIETWKLYLKHYPDGVLGRSAIQYLNAHGDFSYRLHALGIRRVPLGWIPFQAGTARLGRGAYPSLRTLGAYMTQNTASHLTIQSFYKDNQALAEARGQAIRNFFKDFYRTIDPDRLKIQSFGRPERVMAGGTLFALDSSIVFKASQEFGEE